LGGGASASKYERPFDAEGTFLSDHFGLETVLTAA
jgi:hypothetical protein